MTALTRRQKDVYWLVAHGETGPGIAGALGIAPHTVKNHCAALRRAYGLHSTGALIYVYWRGQLRRAYEEGRRVGRREALEGKEDETWHSS